MLRTAKDLEECTIGATDGTIGTVRDIYFDDETWVVRYLVVDTGHWLAERRVLISPRSLRDWGWEGSLIPAQLTREQVRQSPPVEADEPVSKQYEQSFHDYYGYPYYWGSNGLWGGGAYPDTAVSSAESRADSEFEQARRAHEDHHLRSCNEVRGYHLHATDGDIGHVQGFLVDEKSWALRFLIVTTSNWWLGHSVLIAAEWIRSIDWTRRSVTTDLTRDAVKHAPSYDPQLLLNFAGEQSLYQHYGRVSAAADSRRIHVA